MTLLAYQQALCDLIASPQLCLEARADPEAALSRYDLAPRERRRLAAVVRQRGMSTSCTLHRVNRITPIYSYLSLTCFLLGDSLIGEVEAFWSQGKPSDLQFGPESERFGRFLKRRLRAGAVRDPYVEEVLDFELAANRLRALSRERGRPSVASATGAPEPDPTTGQSAPHPLVRVVEFRHEPLSLLGALSQGRRPDPEPERGRYLVALDASGGGLELRNVPARESTRSSRS
jgi:hypothetical protein